MASAAGRISRIGGEWYLWPAYWQGPSFSFSDTNFTGAVEWKPYRSYRDLINRVNGTYTAPNFPWNVTGNLYDANGFYNGFTQNNFAFAFQPTNYPQYAADVLHGYASDQYLIADGGKQLPLELTLNPVLSVSQAQRIAKIALLRNRQQGMGTFHLNLACWQMQPVDVFLFDYANYGWTSKVLEVGSVKFSISSGSDESAPSVRAEFEVHETAETVYEWSTVEELTVYDVGATPTQYSGIVAPPTSLTAVSSAATALVSPDGKTVTPRIEVTWDTPLDTYVSQIQIQYQVAETTAWLDGGIVSVEANLAYIANIVAGQQYNIQIASVRANGNTSAWVGPVTITAGLVLSIETVAGLDPGSLVGDAYDTGYGAVTCNPFTALIGQVSLPILPGGAVTVSVDGTSGLAPLTPVSQQTLYYVYYIDLTSSGGNITPIVTTNPVDFLGKLGYWLIGTVTTPYAAVTGSGPGGSTPGSLYQPSTSTSVGTRTPTNPSWAYDGNTSTSAGVGSSATSIYRLGSTTSSSSYGNVTWGVFPSYVAPSGGMTLSINLSSVASATNNPFGAWTLTAVINGVSSTIASGTNTTQQIFTAAIAAGVNLNTISVTLNVAPGTPVASSGTTVASASTNVSVFEIYAQ